MHIVHPIDEEIEKIESYFSATKIIDHQRAKKQKWGYKIDFSVKTESYISENKKGEIFHFELLLEEKKEKLFKFKIFTQKGSEIPFHPNFKIIGDRLTEFLSPKRALWVHSSNKENDPILFVKTMIDALQYKDESIDTRGEASNKRAETWFYKKKWEEHRVNPPKKTISNSPQKKFSIGKKEVKKRPFLPVVKENKKFEIKDKTGYQLQEKPIPKEYFIIDKNLNSTCKAPQSDSLIYLSNKAKKQIWEHIQWGNMETSINEKEQGGILLGHVYFDNTENVQFAFVTQVVAGRSARGNSTYLEMDHGTWNEMLEEADIIIDKYPEENIQVIGWYHTHPMGLDVFMSSTDRNTQSRFFNQEWHYAIVLNPHREIWKSFVGEKAEECRGYIIKEKESDSREILDNDENIESLKKKDKWMLLKLLGLISLLILLIISIVYQKEKIPSIKKTVKAKEVKETNKEVITNSKDSVKTISNLNLKSDTIIVVQKSTPIKTDSTRLQNE